MHLPLLENAIQSYSPCGQVETAEHFVLYCPLFTELINDTIGKILMPYNIEILLKGCPLYSDNVNG